MKPSAAVPRLVMVLMMVCASSALAQRDDDEPIPYDDEAPRDEVVPRKSKRPRPQEFREEEDDARERETSLASIDDPNYGVGGTVLSGVALLEASRGALDPRYFFGLRFTWEWGRLIPDEYLREMFFADLSWFWATTTEGTDLVRVSTSLHDFTIAPAVALRLGQSFLSAYAQLGAGFAFSESITTTTGSPPVSLGGTKFLFQYGLGLRGRPALTENQAVRLEFRLEATRFIRGYIHETYLGGGLGLVF